MLSCACDGTHTSSLQYLKCFAWIHQFCYIYDVSLEFTHILFMMFFLNSSGSYIFDVSIEFTCMHAHALLWFLMVYTCYRFAICFMLLLFLNWQQRQCVYVEWENHLSRFKGKHKHVNALFLVPLLPPICLVPLFPHLGLGVQAFSFSFGLIFLCIVSLPSFVAVGSIMY